MSHSLYHHSTSYCGKRMQDSGRTASVVISHLVVGAASISYSKRLQRSAFACHVVRLQRLKLFTDHVCTSSSLYAGGHIGARGERHAVQRYHIVLVGISCLTLPKISQYHSKQVNALYLLDFDNISINKAEEMNFRRGACSCSSKHHIVQE